MLRPEHTLSFIKYPCALAGLMMSAYSLNTWREVNHFRASASSDSGLVVRLQPSDSDGTTLYSAVVSFEDDAGRSVQFTSQVASSPPVYDVGESVEVLYLESDPTNARVNGWQSLWFTTTLTGVMGAIFGTIGFVIIGWQRRRKGMIEELKRTGIRIEAQPKPHSPAVEGSCKEPLTNNLITQAVFCEDE